MSYTTGSRFDFEQRLHALPQVAIDLAGYLNESKSYTGVATDTENQKWNKEFQRQYMILSGAAAANADFTI